MLSEVKKYCGRAAIIKEGKLIATDTIENLAHTNAKSVRIVGLQDISLDGAEKITRHDNAVEFIYNGKINALLAALHDKDITDLTIEEPSLDDVFMHYYGTDE